MLWKIPAYPAAIAAIDMALYDLMGQALNVPVYNLLGGKSRPGIGLYPVIPLDEPQVMAAMSAHFVAMGADTLKVKLGSSPDLDLLRLGEIRNAVGDSVKLRLDINQGWHDAPPPFPRSASWTDSMSNGLNNPSRWRPGWTGCRHRCGRYPHYG